MLPRTLVLAAALSIGAAQPSSGGLILASDTVHLIGGFRTVFDSAPVHFSMQRDIYAGSAERIALSEDVVIDESDVGRRWSIDAASTALIREELSDADDLGAFGVKLTHLHPEGNSSLGVYISELSLQSQGHYIPLLASETERVIFTLLKFKAESPGSNVNGDGIWTNYSIEFRIDFLAAPSPGACSILLTAGWLQARRRRCT